MRKSLCIVLILMMVLSGCGAAAGEPEQTVKNGVVLDPGYTHQGVVQFQNVKDFGVTENDTPLNFEGTVLLNGVKVEDPVFVGYPENTTIALKILHQDKALTVMEGSTISYGDVSVTAERTFNAVWDGTAWTHLTQIPEPPAKQYITVDGEEKELVSKTALTPGYTIDNAVQFTNFYDFGLWDERAIGFSGNVYLNGTKLSSSDYRFDGYADNTTIVLKVFHGYQLIGNVLTVEAGSVIFYDDEAVTVAETFCAMWDGEAWTNAEP